MAKIVQKELSDGIYIPPQPELVRKIEQVGADLEKIATQAVIMLGIDRVTNIVKTVLLKESMSKASKNMDIELFWQGSFSVAVAASTICGELNLPMADEAYTLGLFHNCGIPVIAMDRANYQTILEQAYAREDGGITREEFSEFGVHHAAAGYRICRVWNLPQVICLAVKHHHSVSKILDDSSIENPVLKTLICVLKMAEHMAHLSKKLGKSDVYQNMTMTIWKMLFGIA